MIPVQPVFSNKYFRKIKSKLQKNISSQFYLSWEDGLWDILRSFSIPKDAVILVPSFFCVDVMNNMKDHGLIPIYYEVDNNLQPNQQDIESKIKEYHVSFLVLFHAVGITNHLVTKKFIQKLPQDVFIIEDCVHRITDPSEIQIYAERHILINSFRKVVPLQGSFIFGKKEFIHQLQGPENTFFYSWSVIILWIFMQISYLLQQCIHNDFGKLAQWFMMRGYDSIGDEKKAGYCPQFFADLYMKLDFAKIKSVKERQVSFYQEKLIKNKSYYVPTFFEKDKKELRGYPIVMEKTIAQQIISYLRSKGLYIRAELDDALWTKNKTIIYVPLGLHLKNIKNIAELINKSFMGV